MQLGGLAAHERLVRVLVHLIKTRSLSEASLEQAPPHDFPVPWATATRNMFDAPRCLDELFELRANGRSPLQRPVINRVAPCESMSL